MTARGQRSDVTAGFKGTQQTSETQAGLARFQRGLKTTGTGVVPITARSGLIQLNKTHKIILTLNFIKALGNNIYSGSQNTLSSSYRKVSADIPVRNL